MSISDYLLWKSEASIRWPAITTSEEDAVWRNNGRSNPDEPAKKTIAPAPSENLVIVRKLEDFSMQNVDNFLLKINTSSKAVELEKQDPFQDIESSNNAGNVVQATASQFNGVNGAGVVFASNGAPESLSDQLGEMRSPLQQNDLSRRLLMV